VNQSYWDKFVRRRISRRRALTAGAAVGASAVAVALVGCGGGDGTKTPTGSPAAGTTPATNRTSQDKEAVKSRGGIYRNYSFDALALDTYDPHQTQFGPMYNMQAAVFSKVLQYDDDVNQVMSPDLAEGMPEQPDELTYVIKLRQGATFHDSPRAQANFPAVAGRELTAEDVKYSIERQINENSPQKALYYRSGHWKTIDTIEIVDNYTLRITTKQPTAPFMHFLADRNAFIVAKETVDANDTMNTDKAMVGTGPFFLEDFRAVEVIKARRNPNWFAKDDNPNNIGLDRPFIDGYDSIWTPQSNSAEEAAITSKQVDSTGFEDTDTTLRVAQANSGLTLYEVGVSGWVNSRLWLSEQSPLKDFRLRQALHLAIDRKTLSEQIFPGGGGRRGYLMSGPISYPITRWALPQAELEQRPGYRTDTAGRQEDLSQAKQLWEAAGGPTSLNVLFAGVPAYIPNKALPEFVRQMQEVFGLTVQSETDPTGYTSLAQCLLRNAADATDGTCAFTWGFDNGWIDLDDWVYPYFRTGGTKNSMLVSDPDLDAMIDKQRAEFEYEQRRQVGIDIQNYLLDKVLARLDYSAPVNRFVGWNYVKNEVIATWFGSNFLYANTWLDQSDPSYSGRPA
jgi:ABC-type transport system substrate-binding protein